MSKKSLSPVYQNYAKRHLFTAPVLKEYPDSELQLVVVIPCFNEPDLIKTLASIYDCILPKCSVEVIIVVNSASSSDESVILQNKQSVEDANCWIEKNSTAKLCCLVIEANDLPDKYAGVGLARKIGMDEASYRLSQVGQNDGVIVGLDADCIVEKNYLKVIHEKFNSAPELNAASIYYEHYCIDQDEYNAIVEYELWLRYYIQGLRYAGYPFAYHTVGSSMAVRCEAYLKQGGMNKRQAAEDFHFLQKFMELGNYTDITETAVYPESRLSDRVPFGTGKALSSWNDSENPGIYAYSIEAFEELKAFMKSLHGLYYSISNKELELFEKNLPMGLVAYFKQINWQKNLEEIYRNSSSDQAFTHRFLRWFNGLKVLHYFHDVQEKHYKPIPIKISAILLLNRIGINEKNDSGFKLLKRYRELDKKTTCWQSSLQ